MPVTVDTAATYEEAVEAGYWGSVLVLDNPVTGTVDEVADLDVTSDEYAQGRAEEANPPDISAVQSESTSKSDSAPKSPAPKSTSKSDA